MEIPSLADFQRIEHELSEVKALLSLYADKAALPKVVTVADIARMEGVSKSQLYQNEQYLLPRFGQSAYPQGTTRWPMAEYLAWSKRDPIERHREWVAHLEAQRRKAIQSRT